MIPLTIVAARTLLVALWLLVEPRSVLADQNDTGVWTWLSGKDVANQASIATNPSGRGGSSVAFDSRNKVWYLYGGFGIGGSAVPRGK